MSVSCSCSSPPLIILSVSITLLSISIAFLSYSIISFQKKSNANLASGSSDTLRKDEQSCNPSREDEKRESGGPGEKSTAVGPLEGDEVTIIITPGSSVSWKRDASRNPLASKKKDDESSPIIRNLNGDGGLGGSPKHDGGEKDAPSGNSISKEDVALNKSINDEGSHASTPPISNTESDASKSIIITPGSSVSREGDASSNPLASKKKDEMSPIISNLNGDGGLGGSPKYDGRQEDAPSGNTTSIKDVTSTKSINDEESHANAPPISDTACDAPKSIPQHRTTSSGGSASRNITQPVKESTSGGYGEQWYCGHCNLGPLNIGLDTHCNQCGPRRDAYSSIPP